MSWSRAAAILLAVVFAWSAIAKATDLSETSLGFAALGLRAPERLAVVVPALEMLTAGLLVVAPPVGGTLALFLLVAFTVVLIDLLRRGLRVSCACFGAVSSHEVRWLDVCRNAVLIGLALLTILG